MAAFPIDPKYAKVLLSATEYDCLDEVRVIAQHINIMAFFLVFTHYL